MNDEKFTINERLESVTLPVKLRTGERDLSNNQTAEHCNNTIFFGWKNTILLILMAVCFYGSCTTTSSKTISAQQAKITLGHYLFFDPQLSVTNSKSCASCHNPRFAFTDGYRKTIGAFADIHARNTPGLINVSANNYFNWADTSITSLEQQMDQPLFGHDVIEMGLQKNDSAFLQSLAQDDFYTQLFSITWPGEKSAGWKHIKEAIAAYVFSLQSYNAPYDLYLKGDTHAISAAAKKGEQLFFSNQLKCSQCHIPPSFGADSSLPASQQFYNIGLYNLQNGNYPDDDNGLYIVTGKEIDKGKFRVPTLRNLSFTAPYFHDGSAETLEDALQVFEQGGRVITKGIYTGDGRKNPYKDSSLTGYSLNKEEKLQLVNFLLSLDDSSVLSNPLFQDPFVQKKN